MALHGKHRDAAHCSHRPEHIHKLFVDANAAYCFAYGLAEKKLLVTREIEAIVEAALRQAEDHTIWDETDTVTLACPCGVCVAVRASKEADNVRRTKS